MFDVEVTNDGKYAVLSTRKDCDDLNKVAFADLTTEAHSKLDGKLEFTPLIDEWLGGFSYLHNVGSKFYFKTNYQAPRSRVIMIDTANFDAANITASMQVVVPEHERNVLESADCGNGMIVAGYL